MPTTVAVTGATGHVGNALLRALIEQGYSIRAMIHTRTTGLSGLPIQTVRASLFDVDSLRLAFAGAEIVFHAAALISITGRDREAVTAVNVMGTRNVIEACRATGVRRLLHFSSVEALSPRPLDTTLDEDRSLEDGRTGSPYALSKARAEGDVRRAIEQGMDAVIVYPTAVVGPFDHRPSLMGRAVIAFATGRFPMLVDGGYDWVDVRDVAEGAVAAARRAPQGSRYLLGGRWASLREIARLVCEASESQPPRLTSPYILARIGAPFSAAFSLVTRKEPLFTRYSLASLRGNPFISHTRAERELGYRPRDLEQTIRDTWQWFRENGRVRQRAAVGGEA